MNDPTTDPAKDEAPAETAAEVSAEQPAEAAPEMLTGPEPSPAPPLAPEPAPAPEMQQAVAATIPVTRSELVSPQPARPAPVERWIKIEKAQLATIAQVFNGHTYTEFALEDVVCISQSKDDRGTAIEVSFTGAIAYLSGMSPVDADELLKKWRAVRAAQRRG